MEDLGKSIDHTKAVASSLLQWKDAVGHFATAKNCLLKHAQKIELREKQVLEMQELIEGRSKEVDLELCSKRKELSLVQAEVMECCEKLGSVKGHLPLVQKDLQECHKELRVGKQQLGVVEKSVTEVSGELELKEKELSSCKTSLEECCNEFQVKETQLGLIKKSIEEHSAKLSAEEEKLDSVMKKLKSKEEELHKICGDIELKVAEFNTIGTSIEERRDELIVKDSELKSLRECCEELASKVSRQEAIQAAFGELGKKLIEKEKCFESLEKTIEERLEGFEMRQVQFEERMKEYDLKEQQLLAMKRSLEEKYKEAVEEDCGSFFVSSQLEDVQSGYKAIDIKHLIAKKQYLAAARCSCEFGLGDKFPPLQLLQDYLVEAIMDARVSESSRESCEAKCKVIDKEIEALRSILECISDYKLNCRSQVVKFTNRIFELVKQKAEERCSLQTSNPADESPQDSKIYQPPVTRSRSTQKKRMDFRDELQVGESYCIKEEFQAQQLALPLQEKNVSEMKEQLEQSNKQLEIKSGWAEKAFEALKISILDCDLELVLQLKDVRQKFELKV